MVVKLHQASSFSFNYKVRNLPTRVQYENVEYFFGSELGAFCGRSHGTIYSLPEIKDNRREITPVIRAALRLQVILIFN